jgi:hypothetical protein
MLLLSILLAVIDPLGHADVGACAGFQWCHKQESIQSQDHRLRLQVLTL